MVPLLLATAPAISAVAMAVVGCVCVLGLCEYCEKTWAERMLELASLVIEEGEGGKGLCL